MYDQTLNFFIMLMTLIMAGKADAATWKCAPNAPVRSKIGSGYVLKGVASSAATCRPIPGARVELWQAGLITQHYPKKKSRGATMNLVLETEE